MVDKPTPIKAGVPKEPKEKKEKKAVAPRPPAFPLDHKITLLSNKEGQRYGPGNNPKKGKSAERFAKYRDQMTVEAARKAGVTFADMRWDSDPRRNLIKIG